MKLDRTIVIPSDNHSLARRLLESLIFDEDVLLVLVLGSDEPAERTVKFADRRAHVVLAGFERKVAWILNPSLITPVLQRLSAESFDLSEDGVRDLLAVALSPDDVVVDVIHRNETVNFTRMEKAFLRAGLKPDARP